MSPPPVVISSPNDDLVSFSLPPLVNPHRMRNNQSQGKYFFTLIRGEVVSGSVELDLHEVHQTKVALNSNLKRQELLENRIKRLAFEAERAQKITRFTTLKTEKLLEAREIYH